MFLTYGVRRRWWLEVCYQSSIMLCLPFCKKCCMLSRNHRQDKPQEFLAALICLQGLARPHPLRFTWMSMLMRVTDNRKDQDTRTSEPRNGIVKILESSTLPREARRRVRQRPPKLHATVFDGAEELHWVEPSQCQGEAVPGKAGLTLQCGVRGRRHGPTTGCERKCRS